MLFNQAISSIFSRDKVDLKILQFDWLRPSWPLSQEQEFFQYMRFVQEHCK